jgi:hypothetical protein
MTVRASPIQTLTVGTGIPPVQPSAIEGPITWNRDGSRVADYNRRFGLTPTPEHVCVLLFCHNYQDARAIPGPSS